jgi:hypothetical protein
MTRCACGASVPPRLLAGHDVVCALRHLRRTQIAAVRAEQAELEARHG